MGREKGESLPGQVCIQLPHEAAAFLRSLPWFDLGLSKVSVVVNGGVKNLSLSLTNQFMEKMLKTRGKARCSFVPTKNGHHVWPNSVSQPSDPSLLPFAGFTVSTFFWKLLELGDHTVCIIMEMNHGYTEPIPLLILNGILWHMLLVSLKVSEPICGIWSTRS